LDAKKNNLILFFASDKDLSFSRCYSPMRVIVDKDGDNFIEFRDFDELKEVFVEAIKELESENE
jgi:hypothetical protein